MLQKLGLRFNIKAANTNGNTSSITLSSGVMQLKTLHAGSPFSTGENTNSLGDSSRILACNQLHNLLIDD